MVVPLVGMAGDAIGIAAALQGLAVLPVAAALLMLALPEGRTHGGEPVEG